jgi:hypothetical protein
MPPGGGIIDLGGVDLRGGTADHLWLDENGRYTKIEVSGEIFLF